MYCEGSPREQRLNSDTPIPQLCGVEPVFQCNVLHIEHAPEHHFHEFPINTLPDPEDLLDNTEVSPDRLDSDDESGNEDEGNQDWYSNAESGDAQPEVETSNASTGEKCPGKEREAPLQPVAIQALEDLKQLLHPARKTGRGYTDPELDSFVRSCMEGMQTLLNFYTHDLSLTYGAWVASSIQASTALGKGLSCAKRIRFLTRQFIEDRTLLPINPYGGWNKSMLADEDLCNDISLYLQEIGKEISAKKLVDFLACEDVCSKHGIEKQISKRTARRYLNTLGYHWSTPKKGQYADGHERDDVIYYRDKVFLPKWKEIQSRMESWIGSDAELEQGPKMPGPRIITWFHDESIFYAHD
jgi:hypothetical protein